MMNMPIKKSAKRLLVISILVSVGLPAIIVGTKKAFFFSSKHVHAFFTPKEASVTLVAFYHKDLEAKISRYISQHTTANSLLNFDPASFANKLKVAFPAIKTVTYHYQPPQTIAFRIEGTTPRCVVNNTFVIGDQQQLLATTDFDPSTLSALPSLSVEPQWTTKAIPPCLYEFVQHLQPEIWQQFSIHYHAPWQIVLTPKLSPCHASVIATAANLHGTKHLAALPDIFQDLCARGMITKNVLQAKHCPLTFDIRLKDQIIVRYNHPVKRGRGHG